MSKRRASLILALLMLAAMLTACGSETAVSAEPTDAAAVEPAAVLETEETSEEAEAAIEPENAAPLDLTGLWFQKGAGSEGMAATIQGNTIGVFFIIEGDDSPRTYWVGTYATPTEDTDTYSWTSDNTYTGNGFLASSADTKEFSYKDGELSFEVSIQGETGIITLVRGDWDTSNLPYSALISDADSSDVLPLEIRESGWVVASNDYLHYYVKLYNPNADVAIEFPSFRITARDGDGILLGTSDQTCFIIYPQEEMVFGSQAFSVDEQPASVEFEALSVEDYNIKNANMLNAYSPMSAVNVAIRSDKVVGEIDNPNDYEFGSVGVTVLMRDENGELIGILHTFASDVAANGTTPFNVNNYSRKDAASCEVYLCQWN